MTRSIEVRSSPIHGVGVFANRYFARGEFVCYYYGRRIKLGKRVDTTYTHEFDDKFQIVGDTKLPARNALNVGQFINDGDHITRVIARDCQTLQARIKCIVNYITRANVINNVRVEKKENKLHVVAAREILSGEELFVTYGYEYWTSRLDDEDDNFAAFREADLCITALRDTWYGLMEREKNLRAKITFGAYSNIILELVDFDCLVASFDELSKSNEFTQTIENYLESALAMFTWKCEEGDEDLLVVQQPTFMKKPTLKIRLTK